MNYQDPMLILRAMPDPEDELTKLRADSAALRAAGNKLAKIVSVAANAPVEQWATDQEINEAWAAWSAALGERKS